MLVFKPRFALVVALSLLALSACSSSSGAKSAATPSSSTASAGASGAGRITIRNFAFGPATLTVTPGEVVTVVNQDSTTHTVTATGTKAFDTGDIAPGDTVAFKAPTTAGSYPYSCTIHPFMHGTLTVS